MGTAEIPSSPALAVVASGRLEWLSGIRGAVMFCLDSAAGWVKRLADAQHADRLTEDCFDVCMSNNTPPDDPAAAVVDESATNLSGAH